MGDVLVQEGGVGGMLMWMVCLRGRPDSVGCVGGMLLWVTWVRAS